MQHEIKILYKFNQNYGVEHLYKMFVNLCRPPVHMNLASGPSAWHPKLATSGLMESCCQTLCDGKICRSNETQIELFEQGSMFREVVVRLSKLRIVWNGGKSTAVAASYWYYCDAQSLLNKNAWITFRFQRVGLNPDGSVITHPEISHHLRLKSAVKGSEGHRHDHSVH